MNFKSQILIAILAITVIAAPSCTDAMFRPPVKGNGIPASMEINISDFSVLNHGVPGKLILKKGETTSLVIEADENIIPLIETTVIRNTLHLKTRENLQPGKNGLVIYLTTPEIKDLSVNGSGNIVVEDVFETGQITLNINGSGGITMEVDTDQLNSRINGSGNLEIKGNGNTHNIDVRGSGSVKAYEVETLKCKIKVMGSGTSYVNVIKQLDADIMGSGNIYVKGSPDVILRNMGSGKVIHTGD